MNSPDFPDVQPRVGDLASIPEFCAKMRALCAPRNCEKPSGPDVLLGETTASERTNLTGDCRILRDGKTFTSLEKTMVAKGVYSQRGSSMTYGPGSAIRWGTPHQIDVSQRLMRADSNLVFMSRDRKKNRDTDSTPLHRFTRTKYGKFCNPHDEASSCKWYAPNQHPKEILDKFWKRALNRTELLETENTVARLTTSNMIMDRSDPYSYTYLKGLLGDVQETLDTLESRQDQTLSSIYA